MGNATVACSKFQSGDGDWQEHDVEKHNATEDSKPKHEVRVSPILGMLPHVLKYPMHVKEYDETRSQESPNEETDPSAVTRRVIRYGDERQPPKAVPIDFVEWPEQEIHARCVESPNY